MAIYTALSLDDARALGALYGLAVERPEALAAGSVNTNVALSLTGGGRAFLRIYEEQDAAGAEAEAALLAHLARAGLPVAPPLARRDGGGALAEHAHKPVAVFPWCEGDLRCQRGVTPAATRAVGAALAGIHRAGSPAPRAGRFTVPRLLARVAHVATAVDPELAAMAPPLRALLAEVSAARDERTPRGLCHGDLFRDNVLFRGDSIAVVLDFESAAEGPFAFDLAVTMLAWCVGDELEPDLARALFDGYREVRPIEPGVASSLFVEARLAALRFTVTRITDYAMRAHLGANVPRDWRRFWMRHERLVALGARGLAAMVGLP